MALANLIGTAGIGKKRVGPTELIKTSFRIRHAK